MANPDPALDLDPFVGPIRPRAPGGPKTSGARSIVTKTRIVGNVVYQEEFGTCSKRRTRKDGSVWECPCMREGGKLHGPRVYAHTTADPRGGKRAGRGRWVRSYYGTELPPAEPASPA